MIAVTLRMQGLNVKNADSSRLSFDVTSDCIQHVKSIVKYIYTLQINVTLSSAKCIYKLASDWGLKQLQNEAGELFSSFLPEDPTIQSQTSLYEYAVHRGDEALQQTCLRYLAWNCEALINSTAWENLPLGLVKALLSRSDLVVPSETFVLKGLERWAAAQGNTSIPENLLNLVRFPVIPAMDLYNLNSQYQAKKLVGFHFISLPFEMLLDDIAENEIAYTSRIYKTCHGALLLHYNLSKFRKILDSSLTAAKPLPISMLSFKPLCITVPILHFIT
ncbi:hypothetical protein LDENG_00044250 [Lucifuga dentata]|nr:hypothetical protein LDENG_00044250 [Lucifuga dentata]